ncbi:glycosyl hydrolase [Coprinopsis cinerea AmutBmut pab1-1]|nr:glycosyl hydrolase [Coprinopsis cinerea AmutBmut pab1-1]
MRRYTLLTILALLGSELGSCYSKETSSIDYVNLRIGTTGRTPNTSGGMIPSVSPPFGMTRWVAQNQVSYVSATPYNTSWALEGNEEAPRRIHGFMATRQPAIWMGESGSIALVPGFSTSSDSASGLPDPEEIKVDFEERGLAVAKDDQGRFEEDITPSAYTVRLHDSYETDGYGDGETVLCKMTATSRVGHLSFDYTTDNAKSQRIQPENRRRYILLEVARPSIITSTPTNITYPPGYVTITPDDGTFRICGYSTERQDSIITPVSGQKAAEGFKGYFCAEFEFVTDSGRTAGGSGDSGEAGLELAYGVIRNGTAYTGKREMEGPLLSAFVFLPKEVTRVDVRVGTSFISIEQARENLGEVPAGSPLSTTADRVHNEWANIMEKRVQMKVGGLEDEEAQVLREVFWTGVARTLQYPYEQHEGNRYWSGYDGAIHELPPGGESYTGYSIWDTYRAAWSWQILFVPERIPGMVQSMLADYQQSGWLPMWKNIVETSIMIATHADSLIAEAVLKKIPGFDRELAWEAVWKDCTVPPVNDATTRYDDREEFVDYEARAGLTSVYNVPGKGWVADDTHSESASRTLGYAYDDYAAYVLARELGKPQNVTEFLLKRAMNAPFTLYNDETGFMEARNADGSWAGEDRGWTEGDKWAYTFDVVHNIPELINRRGGRLAFVKSLEEHFEGGHNDHTNEPSHHIPYLYALAGAAFRTQELVREIAKENYNNKADGLTGNEDCGQMSAWFIFSAMGFYPVNPVSGEYVIGSPFFEEIRLDLPSPTDPTFTARKSTERDNNIQITIRAPGARTKPYIKSLKINGVDWKEPVIRHTDLVDSQTGKVDVVFEMSENVEEWGNDPVVLRALRGGVVRKPYADEL